IDLPPQFQSSIGLMILAAKVHMAGHRPAVAGFEYAVTDKEDQSLEDFFCFQIQKTQIEEADHIIFINHTAGSGKFCTDKTARCICIQGSMDISGSLYHRTEIIVLRQPSHAVQQMADVHIICSPVREYALKDRLQGSTSGRRFGIHPVKDILCLVSQNSDQ